MRFIYQHSLQLLTGKERKIFFRLIGLQFFLSVADMAFVTGLFYFLTTYAGHVFNPLQEERPSGFLTLAAFLILLLFVIKNAAGYFLLRYQYRYNYAVASRMSEEHLQAFFAGPYMAYAGTDSSVYMKKISQTPVEFAHYVLFGFQQIILQGLLLLLAVTGLIFFSPAAALFLSVVLIPPAFLFFFFLRKATLRARSSASAKSAESIRHLKEGLNGYTESHLYNAAGFFTRRYKDSQQVLNHWLAGIQSLQAMPARFLELFVLAGGLLFFFFYNRFANGPLPAWMPGILLGAAYKIIPGLSRLLSHYSQVMAYAPVVDELKNTSATATALIPSVTEPLRRISVKDICFGYDDRKVLDKISFELEAGRLTGMDGVSGKGKSTLLHILLGFLEPQSGMIFFNDKQVTAAERRLYWPQLSLIKQEGFFLHDSLAANITLSCEVKNPSRLEEVIRLCGLDALAKEPEDDSAAITESGRNISGGQRQRVALARALYKEAPVLFADEPFSELDKAAEETCMQYLKELALQGKMVLLITHNRESLMRCDTLISLHENEA